MTPLQINKSFLDSVSLFKLGLFDGISEASRILQIRLFFGVVNRIFQENLWLKFSFKCFAGSESLKIFSCFSHRSSMLRPVSLMYVCSQTHTLSSMTHAECRLLLFSLKSCFTFIVIHFILTSYELFFNETFWKCFISGTIDNFS